MGLANNDPIFTWIDRVTGLDFARAGGASTSVPTFLTDVVNNFRPVARFDGGDYLDSYNSLFSEIAGGTEQTVFLVCNNVTDTGFGAFLAKDASGDRGFNLFKDSGVGQGVRYYVPISSGSVSIQETDDNVDDTETHIITGIYNGGNSRQDVYFDGHLNNELSPSVPASIGNDGPANWRIGNDHFSDLLVGDILEILLYDREINETERALIQAALDLKYMTPLSPAGVTSGLCMWLRADDLSLTDTDPVDTWDTLAGGGRFTQTGAARPHYSVGESLNGALPMVQFRRSPDNETMESQDNYLQELTEMTLAMVGKPQNIAQSFNTWISSHNGAGGGFANFYWRFYQNGGATLRFQWYSGSGVSQLDSTTSMVVDNIYRWIFTVNSSGVGTVYLNGTQEATGGSTVMPGAKGSPQQIFLAVQGDLGTQTRGDVDLGEVLIYNRVLSGSEITTLDNYLTRWMYPGDVTPDAWFVADTLGV